MTLGVNSRLVVLVLAGFHSFHASARGEDPRLRIYFVRYGAVDLTSGQRYGVYASGRLTVPGGTTIDDKDLLECLKQRNPGDETIHLILRDDDVPLLTLLRTIARISARVEKDKSYIIYIHM